MIIVTGDFFKKSSFFIHIISISKIFFWTILNLFSWHLNTFKKHKEQVCFLLTCSFFTCCFVHLLYFSTSSKHTGWVSSLIDCCFAITLCNQTLHLLFLDRFIKTNPFPCQPFSQWSLNFILIRLTSAEIWMSELSKVW